MNYITLILTISILFGLSDFLTTRVPQLQRLIYVIAAVTIYLLFTIKYYYGQDMLHYYNYYANAPYWREALFHPENYNFEQGYTLLCSICHGWGLSFYWFTAVISTIYFIAIYLLWRHIPSKRSFALMILICLDYSLIFAAFRQCLSVSFFIFMLLCIDKKKYLLSFIFALATIMTHKSGVVIVGALAVYLFIKERPMQQWVYPLLTVLLALLLFVPMGQIWSHIAGVIHLPEAYSHSITHHFTLGRRIQTVFILYMILLVILSYIHQYVKSRTDIIAASVLAGIVIIVLLYQSYYILNRIRSYFLPPIIAYAFYYSNKVISQGIRIPYFTLLSQAASVLVFAYVIHNTYSFHRNAEQMTYPIYNTCTVFDLIDHPKKDVQQRQLKLAKNWWKTDFKRGLKQNQVTSSL